MSSEHSLAAAAGAALFEKAELRLKALLAEHGVSDPTELTPSEAGELLMRALSETAATHFPSANLELLAHGARSFAHPAFPQAFERVSIAMTFPSDPLAPAAGVYAAIVLAGFGLPVAPFDLEKACVLEEPTNDIDTVVAQFARWKTAYVGYNVCAAPFYVLLTDCVHTLVKEVPVHPTLKQVKQLFERPGSALPPDPGQSFVPGMAIFARLPGETISMAGLLDWSPSVGSIVLHAGWQIDGKAYGAPNDGYMPVPVQLLRAVVSNPAVAYALACPVGAPATKH